VNCSAFAHGVVAVLALAVAGGCCSSSLPDGEPPRGPIVEAGTAASSYSPAAAQNRLATSFSVALLNNFAPGSVVTYRRDFVSVRPDWADAPEAVVRQGGDLFRFSTDERSPWRLVSRIAAATEPGRYGWTMELYRENRLVWHESVVINDAVKAGK